MYNARDRSDLRPLHARHRIEIDTELVRMIEIVVTDRMRMEVQACQVCHPWGCGGVTGDAYLGRAGRGKLERDQVGPRGTRSRCALLIEELTADTVGIADENVRPIAGGAKRTLGNREVV